MGQLLSKLNGRTEAQPIDLPIDFNGISFYCTIWLFVAAATSAEVEYASFLALTQTFPKWIKTLETYNGCGEFIRQVIFIIEYILFNFEGDFISWKGYWGSRLGSYSSCYFQIKRYVWICYASRYVFKFRQR